MSKQKQPKQNPNNLKEFWCNCPIHKCYINRSFFNKNSSSKYGITTCCKQQMVIYNENRTKNKDKKHKKTSSLDRSKWENFNQYLMDNIGYCRSLLNGPYNETKAKKIYEEVYGK
jgi:hypothetical protein